MISEIRRRFELGDKVILECFAANSFLNHENGKHRAENEIILQSKLRVKSISNNDGFIEIYGCDYNITRDELDYFKIKEKQEQDTPYSEKLISKDTKFQEMLTVASNAVDKGVLSCFTVNDMDYSDMIGRSLYLGLNMTYHAIENEIKGIEKMMDENNAVEQEVEDSTFNDLIDKAVVAYKDGVLGFFEVGSDGTSRYILATHNEKDLLFHDGDSSYSHAVEYINSLYNETFMIESEDDIERVSIGATIELSNGNKDKVMHTDKYSKQVMIQFTENKHWGAVGLFILKGATVTQQKGNK